MKAGTYVTGIIKGFKSTPWKNDPTKFNHKLGLVVGSYQDEWGTDHEQLQAVDIQAADVERVRKLAADHQGTLAIVPAVFRARPGGRDGAWLSVFMPQQAEIQLQGGK